MQTWKLTLEYDGTNYHGWQEQLNARSLAGTIKKACEQIFGQPVEFMGSGRTDAGVHAFAQVAHAKLRRKVALVPERARRELNDLLPADIVVLSLEEVHPDFHARHDASARAYLYQISTRKTAFNKRQVWWVKDKLNLQAMADAASLLPGRHDFRAFAQPDHSKPDDSTLVVVTSAEIGTADDLILFRIEASHFLWKMVRRLVGALVKIGQGELTLDQFRELLNGESKLPIAAWTAPSSGLFLEKITYGPPRQRSESRSKMMDYEAPSPPDRRLPRGRPQPGPRPDRRQKSGSQNRNEKGRRPSRPQHGDR